MSSLAKHNLSSLTKDELLQDVQAATVEMRHSRHAYEIDRHEAMLTDVIGELNWRFPGWQQPAAAEAVPYEKEFMTCALCGKYRGCWTDSEVCSDCNEAEDERKMSENEAIEDKASAPALHYTAPPAPNGRRHLALGVIAAFALCGLLHLTSSCVTRPVTKAVGREVPSRDSRTKRVEPYMSRK